MPRPAGVDGLGRRVGAEGGIARGGTGADRAVLIDEALMDGAPRSMLRCVRRRGLDPLDGPLSLLESVGDVG